MIGTWKLETDALRLRYVDMHTAGEPVRIVDARRLPLRGTSIIEHREELSRFYDPIRRMLMLEPRGHADMYGVVLVPPSSPQADVGAVFTHVSGYSTMCGHATIALGRYLHDGLGGEGVSRFVVDCPCGPVTVSHDGERGQVGRSSFENVDASVLLLDQEVDVPGIGLVRYDVAYGGAYYAVLPAAAMGVELRRSSVRRIADAAAALVAAVRLLDVVRHPDEPALGFLYGAILTEPGPLADDRVNDHLCWFGEGQIDRSPTGSGVSARLALAAARGEDVHDREFTFAGISGEPFTGRVLSAGGARVRTLVGGRAFYSGRGLMVAESSDPFRHGFDPLARRVRPGDQRIRPD